MKLTSFSRVKLPFFFKKHKFLYSTNTCTILFSSLGTAILLSFYLLYNTKYIQYISNIQEQIQSNTFIHPKNGSAKCDLFKGQWIPDDRGSLYTNHSCKTIPFKRNCFLNGRKGRDFLDWRWKPDQCELPRFDPEAFLTTLQGKTMAFIGDSVSRNQMESLLCLLSTVEIPKAVYEDINDKFTTWEFPKHNFTLMALWSQFLVTATERIVNGSSTGGFDLQLDKIDTNWSEKLTTIDYAIFSDAHWFFRQNHLYEGGKLIGCVYCQSHNVTDLGPGLAIRKAFQSAFREIRNCKKCRKITTFLRTFSPAHFENGSWDKGGFCNQTKPVGRDKVDRNGYDWSFWKVQMEEIDNARNAGEGSGNVFEVLDIMELMSMRPDGHPGLYWGNAWMKGYSDCIHWCLPGPIDTWNELLFEVIKKQAY